MVRIRVATTQFSSISFLLTAHARNAPPSTIEAGRVWVAVWSGRLGLGGYVWAIEFGRLGLGCYVWAVRSGRVGLGG